MSTTNSRAPTYPGALSTRLPAASGYFAHHGIWAPGVRLFRAIRFSAKAAIISLAFVVPLLALVAWQLMHQSDRAMKSRADATRQHVEIAHGILVQAHGLETKGKLTRDQAQQWARETVAGLRYEGSEYFWINDMHPHVVMHSIKPELNGKDVSDLKDPNGLRLFSKRGLKALLTPANT